MACHPQLTSELVGRIVASIRSGGYPHVAAQAVGVAPDLFDDWLRRGGAADAPEPYASFARHVSEAQAQARLRAEIAAFQDEPRIWLNNGPGRESAASPGWSAQVKATEGAGHAFNALLDPQLVALFQEILNLLAGFPDARKEVALLLLKHGMNAPARAA